MSEMKVSIKPEVAGHQSKRASKQHPEQHKRHAQVYCPDAKRQCESQELQRHRSNSTCSCSSHNSRRSGSGSGSGGGGGSGGSGSGGS
eukprot:359913-Amphidinium_carterae.1